MDDIVTHYKFALKLLKTKIFSKKYISKKLILTQCLQDSGKNVSAFYFQGMSIWIKLTSVVWRGDWFGGETGLAGRLVWRGDWFGGETGLAGRLVSQGNCFLVTLAKIFIIILVVKQITYNAKFK